MARVSFTQLNNLSDTISAEAFELIIPNIPLGGSTQELTLRCQQAQVPGYSNEAFESLLHGHVLKFRGRKMYPRQLSVTYIEGSFLESWTILNNWHEFIAGTDSGNSGAYKNTYSTTASLIIYNTTGAVANTLRMENFFIQEISDVTLDGSNSTPMLIPAMFSYDRLIANNTPVR